LILLRRLHVLISAVRAQRSIGRGRIGRSRSVRRRPALRGILGWRVLALRQGWAHHEAAHPRDADHAGDFQTCPFDFAGVLPSETCQDGNSLRSGNGCASHMPRVFSIRSLNFRCVHEDAGQSNATSCWVRVPMRNDRPVMRLPGPQPMTALTKLLASDDAVGVLTAGRGTSPRPRRSRGELLADLLHRLAAAVGRLRRSVAAL